MMMMLPKTSKLMPPLAEVLTLDKIDGSVGYRIGGVKPGPNMIVIGHGDTTTAVYQRILKVPTLGWMRGRMTLLELDAIPELDAETLGQVVDINRTDHVVLLSEPTSDVDSVSDGYWSILEACAELGMISGRGIPRKHKVSLRSVSLA